MKRKFLALLLAFVMVVGMLPVSAFAAPPADNTNAALTVGYAATGEAVGESAKAAGVSETRADAMQGVVTEASDGDATNILWFLATGLAAGDYTLSMTNDNGDELLKAEAINAGSTDGKFTIGSNESGNYFIYVSLDLEWQVEKDNLAAGNYTVTVAGADDSKAVAETTVTVDGNDTDGWTVTQNRIAKAGFAWAAADANDGFGKDIDEIRGTNTGYAGQDAGDQSMWVVFDNLITDGEYAFKATSKDGKTEYISDTFTADKVYPAYIWTSLDDRNKDCPAIPAEGGTFTISLYAGNKAEGTPISTEDVVVPAYTAPTGAPTIDAEKKTISFETAIRGEYKAELLKDGTAVSGATIEKFFEGAAGQKIEFTNADGSAFADGSYTIKVSTRYNDPLVTYFTTEAVTVGTAQPTEYTVTFNLNGGNVDGKTDAVTVKVEEDGKVPTASIPTPTQDGYEFDGWATRSGDEGSYTYTKVDLAEYTVSADVILYAQWNAVQPTIEVVPANLTTVVGQEPPTYGQATDYKAELDADTKTITVTATGLQKTENSEGTTAYWVGIGLTQLDGATYATGWGTYKEADAKFEAADSSQVVDGETYDTMYWGADSASDNTFWTKDANETGYVAVKTGETTTVYTIKFDVAVATYKLTTSHTGDGTVVTDPADTTVLYEGGEVTITATPGTDQKVATMTVNGAAVSETPDGTTGAVTHKVTIGKADVAVAVSFVSKDAKRHTVTVPGTMPDGIESITTVPSSSAFTGEKVNVTVTAKTGYEVTAVTFSYEEEGQTKTETVTGGSFIMPDADVTVTATAKATISAGFAWTAEQANADRNAAAEKFGKAQGLNDGLDQTVWFMINTDIKGNYYWYEISDGTDVLWEGAMTYAADATARGMISASFLHTNPNGGAHNEDNNEVPATLVVKVWKTAEEVDTTPADEPFDSKTIPTGTNPLDIDTVTTAIAEGTVTVKFNQDLFGRYVIELKKGSDVVSAETLECVAPTAAVAKATGYTFSDVTFEDGAYTVSVYQAKCEQPTAATPNPVTGSAFASKSFTIGTVTVGSESGKFNTAAGTKVKDVVTVTEPAAEAGKAFVGWVVNDTDTPITTEDLKETVLTETVTYKAKFREVTSTDIVVTPFSGDTTLGKNGSELQTGVEVTESAGGKTFSFTGKSNYIFDWTEFSSVPAEQEGNFLAIKIVPAVADSAATIKVGNATLDETGIYVVILNGSNGYKNTVTVTAGDKTAEYTLDFTNVNRLPGTITEVAKKTGDEAISVAFQSGKIILSGIVANDEALNGLVLNVKFGDVVKEIAVTLTKDAENNTITATSEPTVLAGNTIAFDTSMLAVKNENAAEHATVAPPQTAVSEDIPEDKKEAAESISNALATATDGDGNTVTKVDETVLQKYADAEANNADAKDTLLSGADAIVKDAANADKVPGALKTAIAAAADENATDEQKSAVTTVVQVYTKIEVTGVETAAGGSVTGFTVSITPMAQTVVTTESKAALEGGTGTITTFDPTKSAAENSEANAIVVDEKPIPVSEPTVVTLALPADAFADGTAYILHEKDNGRRYVYSGTVSTNVLTFTSTHGFSSFTITGVDPTMATTGGVNYASLADAITEVENGGTIQLVKDCAENVTVSKPVVFTLDLNGHTFTGTISPEAGKVTMTKDGNTYTFTEVDSTVAMIGETKYDSLAEAVAHVANNETIKLVANVTLTGDITVSREVKFTVDLNGYTITGGAIVAGDGYKNDSTTENEYNFVSTGGGNPPSGGGSGGSVSYAISVPANVANGKISVNPDRASGGTKVTITATPDEGYKVGAVTVTDKDGNKINVTDAGGNKYTFTMPKSKVDVNVTFVSVDSKFVDVPADSYYAAAVDWAVAKGITVGTSETTFSPDKVCTRAEVVTFLWRAAGSPESTGANPFTDVAEGAYYYDAVLWAVEKGITVGTSEITFSPDTVCSRSEIVTFLWRYEETPEAGASSFDDVKADDWFYDAVNWAVSEEITVGTGENAFSPAVNCTRAEVVTFLFRDMA